MVDGSRPGEHGQALPILALIVKTAVWVCVIAAPHTVGAGGVTAVSRAVDRSTVIAGTLRRPRQVRETSPARERSFSRTSRLSVSG
jgi:hypothetical protein